MLGTALKIIQRVQTQRPAGRGAGGAACPLRGRSFANATNLQRRQASPGRIAGDSSQPAIDHRGDAVDGDRTLGDVGGQNEFTPGRGLDGTILLGWREVSMQRKHQQIKPLAGLHGGSDFGSARQKD